jgi:hypothetical protein
MERRDYLLTQIQKLGQFLKILIEQLLGKSSPMNFEQLVLQNQDEFKDKCGFDMHLLAAPDFEELKHVVLDNDSYSSENLELLADYMVVMAEKDLISPPTLLQRLRLNALQLYETIEIKEKTYSLERQKKIADLRMKLEAKLF